MTHESDYRELLPCPFCGNASVTARECSDDDDRCAVACDSKASECPMEITVYDCYDRESAIAAWNRRASVPNTGTALSEEEVYLLEHLRVVSHGLDSMWAIWIRRLLAIIDRLSSAPSRGSEQ